MSRLYKFNTREILTLQVSNDAVRILTFIFRLLSAVNGNKKNHNTDN